MPCWLDALIDGLKEWQTLIAGVLAIVAAIIGGGYVLGQTREQRKSEKRRLERQHAGARAVLPLALSTCIVYAQDCVRALMPLLQAAEGELIPRAALEGHQQPVLDSVVISPLRDAIESGAPEFGDRVAQLIAEIQLLIARQRDLSDRRRSFIVVKANIETLIVDAAQVYSRAGTLFNYARRETDEPPSEVVTEQELYNALMFLGFDASTDPRLYSLAKAHAEQAAKRS